jgi:hypothetical protein
MGLILINPPSSTEAFWDSLADDLRLATPCFNRVVRVLLEVRDAIVDLAGSREADTICEMIDGDFLRVQAERKAYSWDEFSTPPALPHTCHATFPP